MPSPAPDGGSNQAPLPSQLRDRACRQRRPTKYQSAWCRTGGRPENRACFSCFTCALRQSMRRHPAHAISFVSALQVRTCRILPVGPSHLDRGQHIPPRCYFIRSDVSSTIANPRSAEDPAPPTGFRANPSMNTFPNVRRERFDYACHPASLCRFLNPTKMQNIAALQSL